MTGTYPRVSVTCPTYNGDRFLSAMLDGLLAQSFRDFEVVIVDDGSSDTTLSILQDYQPRFAGRLRVYENATNQGQAAASARTVALSTGEFIAFTGQDDLFEPDFLRASVAALDADPGLAASFGSVKIVDEAGRDTGKNYYIDSHATHADLVRETLFPLLLSRNLFHALGGVFRRTPDFAKLSGFRNDSMHDWELCLNLVFEGGFRFVADAVACCRVHADNVSGNSASGRTSYARQYTFDRDQMLRRVLMSEKFVAFAAGRENVEDFLFECTRNLRADASFPSPLQRIFFAQWLELVHHRDLVPPGSRLQSELMEGLEAIGLYSKSFRIGAGTLRKKIPTSLVECAANDLVARIERESPNFEIKRIGLADVAETKLHEMVWISLDSGDAAPLEFDLSRFWVIFLQGGRRPPDLPPDALLIEGPMAVRPDRKIILYYEDFIKTRGAGLAWRERQSWLNALTPERFV